MSMVIPERTEHKYEPYPEYEDSGVEWLGKVPAHWYLEPLGINANLIVPMRDKPPEFNGEVPWIRIEDFNGKFVADSKTGQRVSEDTIRNMNLKVYPVGTVLCSCSCSMGATAIVTSPLISNQTFIGIVPSKRLLSDYVYYLMQVAKDHLDSISTGSIQQYLSRNDFSRLRIPLFSIQEQKGITDFLDRETAGIDELIARKQRLIELLQEQRAALIPHTVTKGLNPDAPMKDSGVEWLGEIPAHWEILSLRRKLQDGQKGIKIGPFGSSLKLDIMQDSGWKVYGQENIIAGDFSLGDRYVDDDKYKELETCSTGPGDILITMMGTMGCCQVVPSAAEIGLMDSHLLRIRVKQTELLPKFIVLLIDKAQYIKDQLNQFSKGSIMQGLNSSIIKELLIAVPPRLEQEKILYFLDGEIARIDSLISRINQAIEKLQEYQSALITAVVTGKIDVRQYVS